MRFVALPLCALISAGMASSAFGQTYDELLRENQSLHAQIQALQGGDLNALHAHSSAHEQRGHDHDELNAYAQGGHSEHAHGESPGQDAHTHHGHAHGNGHSGNGHSSNGHGGHGHAGHGGCSEECETHFDYFCPFQAHEGGHGNCDLCKCHPQGSTGSGGHDHGHGHGDDHQHGPAYHHSIEGYPLVHGIRTEIDFVERFLELQLANARGADDGQVDETEFETEVVYALNDRLTVIVGVPYVALDPIVESNTSGIGDIEFGLRFVAFNGERDGLFVGMNASAPTGDDERDLGEGIVVVEPTVLWVHDFGGGTYVQHVSAVELPLSADDPGNDFRYDTALFHTFTETANAEVFRYLTPIFEVNGITTLNGPDSGRTVIDLTGGFRFIVGNEDEIGIGWSAPVSGDRNFDDQLFLSYLRHF